MSLPKIPRKACRGAALAIAVALAASVAACSSGSAGPNVVCPTGAVTPGLDLIPQFGPGAGHQMSDVEVSGQITSIKTDCDRAEKGIAVHALIAFEAKRVRPDIKETDLPYFVAVADSRQHILAKQNFTLKLPFPAGQGYTLHNDRVTVRLPLNSVSAGGEYVILVGFQLTAEQREFMKSHKLR